MKIVARRILEKGRKIIEMKQDLNTIKIKKTDKNTKLPFKKHETDSGWDLTVHRVIKKSLFKIHYGLGISMDLPENLKAEIAPRSSIHNKYMLLSNSPGQIDNTYKGEWQAVFYKIPFLSKPYKIGERCCQAIFSYRQDLNLSFKTVDQLTTSERGSGGYGSTGDK